MKFVLCLCGIGQKRQLRCRTQKSEIDGALIVDFDLPQAAAVVRDCYLPKAGIGRSVPIWITENGVPTGTRSQAQQAAKLAHSWIAFATAAAPGSTDGQPDFVAGHGAIDGL